MGKPEKFLWVVQTLMIHNAILLARDPNLSGRYLAEVSAAGVTALCHEALWASERIPEEMTAADAAHEFFFFMSTHYRDESEKGTGRKMDVPAWFARG